MKRFFHWKETVITFDQTKSKHVEIISINETMLDLSVSNQEIKISGYNIVRKDRNGHGGGDATYIITSINFIIRDDLTDDNLETITLEISKPKA